MPNRYSQPRPGLPSSSTFSPAALRNDKWNHSFLDTSHTFSDLLDRLEVVLPQILHEKCTQYTLYSTPIRFKQWVTHPCQSSQRSLGPESMPPSSCSSPLAYRRWPHRALCKQVSRSTRLLDEARFSRQDFRLDPGHQIRSLSPPAVRSTRTKWAFLFP